MLTNCPKKITVSQAVSQADLCTPDMDRVKWFQQLLRTVMLWEFFSSVFIIAQNDTWNIEYLISSEKSRIATFWMRYFLRASSL